MRVSFFRKVEARVLQDKEGKRMAQWARKLSPPDSSKKFLAEYIWVVLCSGISFRAAQTMEAKFYETGVCKHPHKNRAIQKIGKDYRDVWKRFRACKTDEERMELIRTLPYMGGKALPFQLAKNLGITCFCKPDVHLVRLAENHGYPGDPQAMCETLAKKTGKTVAYVDTVLWYAAMRKWI